MKLHRRSSVPAEEVVAAKGAGDVPEQLRQDVEEGNKEIGSAEVDDHAVHAAQTSRGGGGETERCVAGVCSRWSDGRRTLSSAAHHDQHHHEHKHVANDGGAQNHQLHGYLHCCQLLVANSNFSRPLTFVAVSTLT